MYQTIWTLRIFLDAVQFKRNSMTIFYFQNYNSSLSCLKICRHNYSIFVWRYLLRTYIPRWFHHQNEIASCLTTSFSWMLIANLFHSQGLSNGYQVSDKIENNKKCVNFRCFFWEKKLGYSQFWVESS